MNLKDPYINPEERRIQVYSRQELPSTTKTIFFVGYLEFLYRVLYYEPTKIMVMVVNGRILDDLV